MTSADHESSELKSSETRSPETGLNIEVGLSRAMYEWSRQARHDEATEQRTSNQIHKQLTNDEMLFGGLLLDVAERQVSITISANTGRQHSGNVINVGTDFITLAIGNNQKTMVSISSIASVRCAGDARTFGTPSARTIPDKRLSLLDLLTELASERTRLRFVVSGSSQVQSGELFAISEDLATFNLDRPATHTLFVITKQIVEVTIEG